MITLFGEEREPWLELFKRVKDYLLRKIKKKMVDFLSCLKEEAGGFSTTGKQSSVGRSYTSMRFTRTLLNISPKAALVWLLGGVMESCILGMCDRVHK